MTKLKFKVEGMEQLQKNLKRLGNVPQKHVTATSRKAMSIALKQARADAPVATGNLKKGIIMVGEKSSEKAKKVYRIVFDKKMNDVFQKPVKNPGQSGNPKARSIAYYPVSQEYGFFAKNGRYIPGFKFVHDALRSNTHQIEKTVVREMKRRIDIEIARGGLR